MQTLYIIGSVIAVSLISIIVILPFIHKSKISEKLLLFLLSISIGVLLSTVVLDFLPEIVEHGYSTTSALYILSGFLLMFLLEKFVHWHHSLKNEQFEGKHSHAYSLAPINLIGDGIHNFIDGMVIAGSYFVSTTVGIAATVSIIFHEIPQEIGDFGVLLYSGMSKKKAVVFNLLSAAAAILGAILGIFIIGTMARFEYFIISFAAGNFIYIAAANLVPQLHRRCELWETLEHIFAICLGVAVTLLITLYLPGH
ncbi:ZIP family metal transporter [Candidatus Woesearchaeota archaeon]|nr:ZIP family metal transporter [Candidatus Woesearchaeota archaeon]